MPPVAVQVENASGDDEVPDPASFSCWASACLQDPEVREVVSLRLVSEQESAQLNRDYRQRDYPTNVLSFRLGADLENGEHLLGDLAICTAVVCREAGEQGKPVEAHWAHMTVHGVLHLLGLDHEEDAEAAIMEQREREILAALGYPDPYRS